MKQFVSLIKCFLILLIIAKSGKTSRRSGLYVDNGFGQTLIHRVISQDEKLVLEDEILNILGLEDRPKKISTNTQVKRSAPQFLMNIYETSFTNEVEENKLNDNLSNLSNGFNLTEQSLKTIDESDSIITFTAHKYRGPEVKRLGKRMWFNVTEVSPEEKLISGNLRLYRMMKLRNQRNYLYFTITVYAVLKTTDSAQKFEYLDSINVTTEQAGWHQLNVTKSLHSWIINSSADNGLYVSVHAISRAGNDQQKLEIKPEDVGIVGFHGEIDKQPFLVGFFKNTGVPNNNHIKRSVRRKKSEASRQTSNVGINSYIGSTKDWNAQSCRIQTLYVSFTDLEWQDWIIAPEGYDAYYCSGECNFPLNAHMNATNHAIVKTLVHLMKPGKIPKPCCAPNKLSPISVLYYRDENNIFLKKLQNMAVKNCGCH